ncbi:hypothetical protein PR048_029535 [Dryococelus australis]|uniref:Uncharacterized protein n=1 Tax=Dryococelus australis TaxID=614101 RepID=A0ABQ9GEB2_9NEOP|nr:hypothetical protein PR048_029535 [Dryococelus australis]
MDAEMSEMLRLLTARSSEPMRVIEVSMERAGMKRREETGEPRENPLTNGIVQHNSHMRKSGGGGYTSGLPSLAHAREAMTTSRQAWSHRKTPQRPVNGDDAADIGQCNPLEVSFVVGPLERRPLQMGVAERLARSPPTKTNRVRSPAGSPEFRKWESCRTMPLVGGFSRGSPVSPVLSSFRCRYIFTSITRIGSQDLAVKSRPNLVTHSLTQTFRCRALAISLDRRMKKAARPMAMTILHKAEEHTTCIQVDLKQSFQLCSLTAYNLLDLPEAVAYQLTFSALHPASISALEMMRRNAGMDRRGSEGSPCRRPVRRESWFHNSAMRCVAMSGSQ